MTRPLPYDTIAVSKFKATCLELLKTIRRTGRPVLVTRDGQPLVLVSPAPQPPRPESWLGRFRGSGEITGDIVSPALEASDWDVLK